MKSGRRHILLKIIALGLLAFAAWTWVNHYRGKRALAEYKRQLIANGEKLTVEELIPPPPPEERDGTAIFAKASLLMRNWGGLLSTNPPNPMCMVSPGRAMISWQQSDIRDSEATNTWDEARAELEMNAEGFELLRQLIERPTLNARLDYTDHQSWSLTGLSKRKAAVQLLKSAVICDLYDDDVASATANMRAMLALSKCATDERLVISQLVRIAMAAISATANWELLQCPQLTEGQLAALQRDWEELELIQSAEHALEMERATTMLMADELKRSGKTFKQYSTPWFGARSGVANTSGAWTDQAWQFAKDSWEKTRYEAWQISWRVAWANPDQLTMLKGEQALLESMRRAQTNDAFLPALRALDLELERLGITGNSGTDDLAFLDSRASDPRMVLSLAVNSLRYFPRRVMTMEASRRTVIIAIALKRFQLRHGHLPADLAALAPEFLGGVPRDPVDGQPLRYRPNNDGSFLLYSVGEDGVDDGGDPRPANEASKSLYWGKGRDWVWPQAASAEEVEVFYREKGESSR